MTIYNGDGSGYDPDAKPTTQEPQSTAVMTPAPSNLDGHEWIQRGYTIEDVCKNCPIGNVGINIASGQLLIKENGHYKLVDEVTRT